MKKTIDIYEACNYLNEILIKESDEEVLKIYRLFDELFEIDDNSIYPLNKDGKSLMSIQKIFMFVVRKVR